MKKVFLFSLYFIFCHTKSYGFQLEQGEMLPLSSIEKPNILSTHPFGLFFNRLQGNFKSGPTENFQLNLYANSGNVWGTPVTVYVPKDETIRQQVRAHAWHQAQYFFDAEALETETYNLQIDGVIKSFRIESKFALNEKSEITIGSRFFMLTSGKTPFSLITGDDFIENFHEKIAGGDDPFDRKVFGLNRAQINYTDRNGQTMTIERNDLVFGGFETSYYYYPTNWSTTSFKANIGSHLGINLSKYNTSLDIGTTFNGIYNYKVNEKSSVNIGFGLGVLRKSLVNFKSNNLQFGTNKFLGNLESVIAYKFISNKRTAHTIGLDYYFQTRLNKREELDYSIPIRHPNAHKSWGHGVTNLYKTNNYWSLYYAFGKKTIKTLYLQQDLQVNNNPDIQTGVGISFNLN